MLQCVPVIASTHFKRVRVSKCYSRNILEHVRACDVNKLLKSSKINQLSPDLIMRSKKLCVIRNQLNHKLNYIRLIFFTFNYDWLIPYGFLHLLYYPSEVWERDLTLEYSDFREINFEQKNIQWRRKFVTYYILNL